MPVIVIGYQLVKRNISLRTSSRVITHLVGVPGNGQTPADLYQLAFRSGGFTREVWPAACLRCAADRVSALYCMLRGTLHPGEQQSMTSCAQSARHVLLDQRQSTCSCTVQVTGLQESSELAAAPWVKVHGILKQHMHQRSNQAALLSCAAWGQVRERNGFPSIRCTMDPQDFLLMGHLYPFTELIMEAGGQGTHAALEHSIQLEYPHKVAGPVVEATRQHIIHTLSHFPYKSGPPEQGALPAKTLRGHSFGEPLACAQTSAP